MDVQTTSQPAAGPPKVIPSLVAGFNAVTNHVQIILFPIVLDLLLWFGPHVRLKQLLGPAFEEMVSVSEKEMSATLGPEMMNALHANWDLFRLWLERFNVLGLLRTFPVGVTSLMSAKLPIETPLGAAWIYELPSPGVALLIWVFVLLAGLVVGSLYFNAIARLSGDTIQMFNWAEAWLQARQTLALTITLMILAVMMTAPILCMTMILVAVSPALAQIALMVLSFVFLWLFLLPLIFTPHGIFALRQNAFAALLTSARLVRYYLPGAGFFLLILLVFSQGLDLLWRTPADDSWMTLIGILGHAFTSTGILAASFVYYRSGVRWMMENMRRTPATTQQA